MNSEVFANNTRVKVPQQISEPVTVHFRQNAIDWANVNKPDLLQVFIGRDDQCCHDRMPIAGRYALADHVLTFTPSFDFDATQTYVARVRIPGMDEKRVEFNLPSDTPMVAARVIDTYPSGNTIAENVLRFYIHFSVPMAPHLAFDHIKLLNTEGIADDAAFMQFKQELWNQDRTRLTVLIDPGRIKRNVATNLELGPALKRGQQYTLSIDGGWSSADGTSVLPAFNRTFFVSDGLRVPPDVKFWQSTSPCHGTTETLELNFDRPFDRHQLRHAIAIRTAKGLPVPGEIQVGKREKSWRFVPDEPWDTLEIRIFVDAHLEDVAGNNFYSLLDQAIGSKDASPSRTTMIVSPARCEKPASRADL